MSEKDAAFDTVLELAAKLTPVERVRLVERLMATLAQDIGLAPEKTPRRASYGILADLGPAPSAEDIDEVRRAMLANFPREDIAR